MIFLPFYMLNLVKAGDVKLLMLLSMYTGLHGITVAQSVLSSSLNIYSLGQSNKFTIKAAGFKETEFTVRVGAPTPNENE